jgi:hypothetical protein
MRMRSSGTHNPGIATRDEYLYTSSSTDTPGRKLLKPTRGFPVPMRLYFASTR